MNLEFIYENMVKSLILEKDHRKKIVKFGVDADVADKLHQINDKYSIWFANQIKDLDSYKLASNKIKWIDDNQSKFNLILDWVKTAPNVKIKNFTWDEALEEAHDYHENLKVTDSKFYYKEYDINNIEDDDGEILKVYDTGYYWIDLGTGCDRKEADCMGHCGNSSADVLWSLRHAGRFYSKSGCNSYVTMGVSPNEHKWTQCKGKNNSLPSQKYFRYICDIFITHDIYEHDCEYEPESDFNSTMFYGYVENNKNLFKNADTVLENIKKHRISYEDFDKALKEVEFKYISVELIDSFEMDEIYVSYEVNFTIDVGQILSRLNVDLIEEENEDGVERILFEFFSDLNNYYGEMSPRDEYSGFPDNLDLESGIYNYNALFNINDRYSSTSKSDLDHFKDLLTYNLSDVEYNVENSIINEDMDSLVDNCVEVFRRQDEEYVKPVTGLVGDILVGADALKHVTEVTRDGDTISYTFYSPENNLNLSNYQNANDKQIERALATDKNKEFRLLQGDFLPSRNLPQYVLDFLRVIILEANKHLIPDALMSKHIIRKDIYASYNKGMSYYVNIKFFHSSDFSSDVQVINKKLVNFDNGIGELNRTIKEYYENVYLPSINAATLKEAKLYTFENFMLLNSFDKSQ